MVEGHEEHEVEAILSHRFTGRSKKLQFLVKWTGQGTEENEWLDPEDLTADGVFENSAIKAYWDKVADLAGTRVVPPQAPTAAQAKALTSRKFTPKHKMLKPDAAKRGAIVTLPSGQGTTARQTRDTVRSGLNRKRKVVVLPVPPKRRKYTKRS
jgi:hypothetical protein